MNHVQLSEGGRLLIDWSFMLMRVAASPEAEGVGRCLTNGNQAQNWSFNQKAFIPRSTVGSPNWTKIVSDENQGSNVQFKTISKGDLFIFLQLCQRFLPPLLQLPSLLYGLAASSRSGDLSNHTWWCRTEFWGLEIALRRPFCEELRRPSCVVSNDPQSIPLPPVPLWCHTV